MNDLPPMTNPRTNEQTCDVRTNSQPEHPAGHDARSGGELKRAQDATDSALLAAHDNPNRARVRMLLSAITDERKAWAEHKETRESALVPLGDELV